MIIVIFSDVHAIPQAVTALEQSIQNLEIDGVTYPVNAVWFLGDVAGYGPQFRDTFPPIYRLMERYHQGSVWLRGNHDDVALQMANGNHNATAYSIGGKMISSDLLNEDAAKILSVHVRYLKKEQKMFDWMTALPHWATPYPGYYLAHGFFDPSNSDDSLWNYGSMDATMRRMQVGKLRIISQETESQPLRLIAVGHHHMPGLWHFELSDHSFDEVEHPDLWETTWHEFPNLAQTPVMLNPGSLSLPRSFSGDSTPRYASYVVLDVDEAKNSCRISFRQHFYPVDELIGEDGALPPGYPLYEELYKQISLCDPARRPEKKGGEHVGES